MRKEPMRGKPINERSLKTRTERLGKAARGRLAPWTPFFSSSLRVTILTAWRRQAAVFKARQTSVFLLRPATPTSGVGERCPRSSKQLPPDKQA